MGSWIKLCLLLSLTFAPALAEETSTRIWANYVEKVQGLISESWRPKGYVTNYYCLASFEVNQDGSLKSVKLEKSSGSRSFDSYALSSIKLASPFPEMPSTNKPLKIKYYFDYKYSTTDFILDSGAL